MSRMHVVPEVPYQADQEVTDSEWLGHAAAQAHQVGRHALGVALGQLALRAAAAERNVANVPHRGTTRAEYPARTDDTITIRPDDLLSEPTTCAHVVEVNGSRGLCNEPIQHQGFERGWRHLDERINDHHPVVP